MRKPRQRRSKRHQFFSLYSCKIHFALNFSNIEVYINNQQIYNSNGLHAQKSYISNNFKEAISENKRVFHCNWYDYGEISDEIMEASLSENFFTKRMKMLDRHDSFRYGELGVNFFSTSEMLHPNMKIRLRLIRTRPIYFLISLGVVDCSLYTRRTALKEDYHKKGMDMLAYTPVEFIYTETLTKTFIVPARQNRFIQENSSNKQTSSSLAFCSN